MTTNITLGPDHFTCRFCGEKVKFDWAENNYYRRICEHLVEVMQKLPVGNKQCQLHMTAWINVCDLLDHFVMKKEEV